MQVVVLRQDGRGRRNWLRRLWGHPEAGLVPPVNPVNGRGLALAYVLSGEETAIQYKPGGRGVVMLPR